MAKKDSLSLTERINRMEVYVLGSLLRRLKEPTAEILSEVDKYVGPWIGQPVPYAGRLGQLYFQRDLATLVDSDAQGSIMRLESMFNSLRMSLKQMEQQRVHPAFIDAMHPLPDLVYEVLQLQYHRRDVEHLKQVLNPPARPVAAPALDPIVRQTLHAVFGPKIEKGKKRNYVPKGEKPKKSAEQPKPAKKKDKHEKRGRKAA